MDTGRRMKFKDWECEVHLVRDHDNGRFALELIEVGTHEPIARATCNIPEAVIPYDCVIVKDYSENKGMLKALVAAGIVDAPYVCIKGDFDVVFPVCKLLIPGIKGNVIGRRPRTTPVSDAGRGRSETR